jgi:hypothetical protein
MLSFRNWLETYGSNGGMAPPKQRPDHLPGAFNVVSPPGSSDRPEGAGPENGKKKGLIRGMRKKMKK